MRDDWQEDADILAAGAACPVRGCGEINFTYHSANLDRLGLSSPLEFRCSRCGMEFTIPNDDLLFHSVRKEWLWAGHHSA